MWVSDKHKALYCNVPKVACSNWKKVLYLMNSMDNHESHVNRSFMYNVIHDPHIHRNIDGAPWRLMHMSPEDIIHRLNTYTSFIVVRRPYSRVLSAYREKFQSKHLLLIWRYWMYRIYVYLKLGIARVGNRHDRRQSFANWRHQNKNVTSYFFMPYGYTSTFPEFVKFATEPDIKYDFSGDQHWMPIIDICRPCQVRYDIIAKLETMDTDARFILKRFGVPELFDVVAAVPSHETNSSAEDVQKSYYSTLSARDIARFQQKYKKDFEYFGYDSELAL